MIYRRPGFLAVVWFGSSPTPPPSPDSKLSHFPILPVFRRSSLLTGEWGRSHIIRQRKSLFLYEIIQFSLVYPNYPDFNCLASQLYNKIRNNSLFMHAYLFEQIKKTFLRTYLAEKYIPVFYYLHDGCTRCVRKQMRRAS